MQEVLEFEKKVLGSPISAIATLLVMFAFLGAVLFAFWKRSLKTALIVLNIAIIGKLILSYIFTGEAGEGTIPVTIFGLILVNSIALSIFWFRIRKTTKLNGIKER